MFSRILTIVGVALLVVSVAAVLLGSTVRANHSAGGMATINITSPVGTINNPQLVGKNGVFTITIAVQNFILDPAHIGSKSNRPGYGHYHVYVDSFDPTNYFKFFVKAAATTTVKITLNELAKAGVTSGTHTIYLVLTNNDHSLVKPLAIASTVIRVVPVSVAAINMTSSPGTVTDPLLMDQRGTFTFSVAPRNFVFDPAHIGSAINKPGSGHYHVYADSFDPRNYFKFFVESGATRTVQVTRDALAKVGVTTGTHTLYIVLANNNHSLIQPLAIASTVIRIGPSLAVAEWNGQTQPLPIPAGGKVTLHLNINGFRLDPAHVGAKINNPGSGHYHLYIDSFDPTNPFKNYLGNGATATVDVTAAELDRAKVVPGIHTLYVVLANNDHSLVTPLTGASALIDLAR